MTTFSDAILVIVATLTWLAGIVLAKGGWWVTLAILFPPFAWYLWVELCMNILGLI